MSLDQIFLIFTDWYVLITFFFKAFSIVGGILYIIYSIIIVRQTKVMLMAIEESGGVVLRVIAFLQLIVSILLFFASIVLL